MAIPFSSSGPVVAQPPWQDPAVLNTLSPAGAPPKSRVSDPDQAQQIAAYLISANRERARRETLQRGMFDGNAPFNSAKLKAAGRGWEANFNTGEGRARKASAKVPFYDLFSGSKTYSEFDTDFGDESDRVLWSRIITEEADRAHKKWNGFSFNMWTMLDDFIGFGKGFLFFQDPYRWRFRKVSQSRVLVHDGVDCDIEEGLELLIVRQSLHAHELYAYIKDAQSASDTGWNRDEGIRAIRDAQPDWSVEQGDDLIKIQQQLKDCDLNVSSQREAKIHVARLYVREFNGRISELIVREQGQSGQSRRKAEWLYKRIGGYDEFTNVLAPFFFEMEDGSWHGCSGLGKDITPQMITKDRLTMATINGAFMRSALLLQAKSPSAMKNAGVQSIGSAIIIPPDVAALSSQMLGDIQTVLTVNQALESMVDSNTGVYRPRMEKPAGNPEPATATQLRFAQSNVLSSSAVDRFVKQEDHLYAEVMRRMCAEQHGNDSSAKSAREFQERCLKRGVPIEALRKARAVRASRTLGNGSIVMRQNAMVSLAPFSARWPESGRQNFDEDVIEAFADSTKVSRYIPLQEKQQLPSDHMEMALLENGNLRTGSPVTWTPTQNNMIHAQTHLEAMASAVASLSQGADPRRVYDFLEAAGPHVTPHLKALSQDPTRQGAVKALGEQWTKLAQITDQLGAKLKEQAQVQGKAQAVQSGMDPEMQLEAAIAQKKMEMSQAKNQHQMNLREQQAQQKMRIGSDQAAQKMALNDAQTAEKIRLQRASESAKPTEDAK